MKQASWLFGVLAVSCVLIAGCSTGNDPVAPITDDSGGAIQVTHPEETSVGSGGGLFPPPPGGGGGIGAGYAEHSFVYIWADRGSALQCGCWSLDIPAYALTRNKVVGLWSIPRMSPGLPENLGIECEITPTTIHFNTPATLTFLYERAGLTSVDPHSITIYVLDSAAGEWVQCPCTLDLTNGRISTPVTGDSRYALGLVRGGI